MCISKSAELSEILQFSEEIIMDQQRTVFFEDEDGEDEAVNGDMIGMDGITNRRSSEHAAPSSAPPTLSRSIAVNHHRHARDAWMWQQQQQQRMRPHTTQTPRQSTDMQESSKAQVHTAAPAARQYAGDHDEDTAATGKLADMVWRGMLQRNHQHQHQHHNPSHFVMPPSHKSPAATGLPLPSCGSTSLITAVAQHAKHNQSRSALSSSTSTSTSPPMTVDELEGLFDSSDVQSLGSVDSNIFDTDDDDDMAENQDGDGKAQNDFSFSSLLSFEPFEMFATPSPHHQASSSAPSVPRNDAGAGGGSALSTPGGSRRQEERSGAMLKRKHRQEASASASSPSWPSSSRSARNHPIDADALLTPTRAASSGNRGGHLDKMAAAWRKAPSMGRTGMTAFAPPAGGGHDRDDAVRPTKKTRTIRASYCNPKASNDGHPIQTETTKSTASALLPAAPHSSASPYYASSSSSSVDEDAEDSSTNTTREGCYYHEGRARRQNAPILATATSTGNDGNGSGGNLNDNSANNNDKRFRAFQSEQWNERYAELVQYRKEFGHCLVSNSYTKFPTLFRWVKRQRYQNKLLNEGKQSTMTQERIVALNAIGFVWDTLSAQWEERLKELEEYKEEHGHCNVPSTYGRNTKLAIWVKCQRRQKRKLMLNQPSNITPERIRKLDALGFVWEARAMK
mmetsp:Transcript_8279/g.23810  ORF Transcript_8279/g.23810 Transcript_8279/m.23810 type:complete len:681 (+) Transcript_8279:162-2204(+)|eukprot:CAMPEP_0119558034 /NCGR_PEP_ID=MMETSP1352-20130426/9900_1 /TAXON_ID=265584 /ORGANISM="Stauroneis constricta, Strain CCMP1120" /LENGTH=680 /DNA_ID=CAMNT_0007605245 /DNA_START=132 /DNA_END=2174 /DNA_ORIENTATION=+